MIPALRRLRHALTHREEYRVDPDTGVVYERCSNRRTGVVVGVKASAPGLRQNFQPSAP